MQMGTQEVPAFWRSASGIAFMVAVAVGGFFLWTEHRAHLFGALPFLFLLACPVMHLFMHHGHGHGATAPEPGRQGEANGPR
jgi:hypothetical protein